jgi:hypothetical protein
LSARSRGDSIREVRSARIDLHGCSAAGRRERIEVPAGNKLGRDLRIDKLAASSRFGYETGGLAVPPGIESTRFPGKKIAVTCPAGSPSGLRVNAFRVG